MADINVPGTPSDPVKVTTGFNTLEPVPEVKPAAVVDAPVDTAIATDPNTVQMVEPFNNIPKSVEPAVPQPVLHVPFVEDLVFPDDISANYTTGKQSQALSDYMNAPDSIPATEIKAPTAEQRTELQAIGDALAPIWSEKLGLPIEIENKVRSGIMGLVNDYLVNKPAIMIDMANRGFQSLPAAFIAAATWETNQIAGPDAADNVRGFLTQLSQMPLFPPEMGMASPRSIAGATAKAVAPEAALAAKLQEQVAKVMPPKAMEEAPPAPVIKPAIKVNGEVIKGRQGDVHATIMERRGLSEAQAAEAKIDTGFVDDSGNFLTHKEASDLIAPKETIAAKPIDAPVPSNLGDPKGGFVPKEVETAYNAGKATARDIVDSINWSGMKSSANVGEAITRIENIITKELNINRGMPVGTRGALTDKLVQQFADRYGLDADLLKSRDLSKVPNIERILASEMVISAARNKLIGLARVAKDSANNGDISDFLRMTHIYRGILKHSDTEASQAFARIKIKNSDADNMLKAGQEPGGATKGEQTTAIEQQLAGEGGATKARSFAASLAEINDPKALAQTLRGSATKRLSDMVIEYWYHHLLSGIPTHMVNMGASAINAFWHVAERDLAASIAQLRGAEDSVQIGEATQMLYGMVGSWKDAIRAGGRTFVNYGPDTGPTKTAEIRPKAITGNNFNLPQKPDGTWRDALWLGGKAIDLIGEYYRLPNRALMAEDEMFKVVSRTGQTRAEAFHMGVTEGLEGSALTARVKTLTENPTEAMQVNAEGFAQEVTLTQPLGASGRAVQSLVNQHPLIGKFVAPFIRISANSFKWAGTRTPLAWLANSVRADIAGGGPKADIALAKMALGSVLIGVVINEVWEGNITGPGPGNPELFKTWSRVNRPNSIKIGNDWYAYDRLSGPMGMLMSTAAGLAETFGPLAPEDSVDYYRMLATAVSRSVVSKQWMSGPADALDAITRPEIYGERWVQKNIGTFLVGNDVTSVARYIDPVWREVDSIGDAIRARTPGASKELPAHTNLWGQDIYSSTLGPSAISPLYKFHQPELPIDNYMWDNRINIDVPGKAQSLGRGATVELTPQELYKFRKLAGNEAKDPKSGLGFYDTMNAIMAGQHYASGAWSLKTDGPEGGRADMIKSYSQMFRDMAGYTMYNDPAFADLKHRIDVRQDEVKRHYTIGPE